MATLEKGSLFPAEVVSDLINKVRGKSSIAKMVAQTPVAFNGTDVFTFSMDNEVNIVAEGGAKPAGGVSVQPVHIVPLKVEYGARVNDEFMYAAEEKQIEILKAFNEGYARKLARGLDLMAMHGINPRTGTRSAIIGAKSFDTNNGVTKITYNASDLEGNLEDAVAALGDYDLTGIALSKTFASGLGKLKVNGVRQYPEFALGGAPESLGGHPVDVNSTVSQAVTVEGSTITDHVVLGDFAGAFRWGYAKNILLEIIPYGDPDQSGEDLKAHNQVYLRSETYIGWGILIPAAFACVQATA